MGGWGFVEAGSVSSTRVPCFVLSAQVRPPCPELSFLGDFVDEAGICLTQRPLEDVDWLTKRPLGVGTAQGNTDRIGAAQGPTCARRSDVGVVRGASFQNVRVTDLCEFTSLASLCRKSQNGVARAVGSTGRFRTGGLGG